MKKFILIALLLLSLPLFSGCGSTTERETAENVLFGDELLGDQRDFLLRWEVPLRLSFTNVPEEEQQDVLLFLSEVSVYAPLLPEFSVADGEEANLLISFVPYAQLQQIAGENFGACRYAYQGTSLVKAEIWIASDTTTLLQRRHLLREELLHALGLTNDQDADTESLLYRCWTETTALSALDRRLLSFLYGDKAYSGMTRTEFQKCWR